MRTLILLAVATILSGVIGFGVDQFAILYAHTRPITAQCLGISAFAVSLLVLIAAMGLQAKRWN